MPKTAAGQHKHSVDPSIISNCPVWPAPQYNPFTHAASCEGRGCDSVNTNIYPDSLGLTCVSSVSGGVVVHTHTHTCCVCELYVWIWITGYVCSVGARMHFHGGPAKKNDMHNRKQNMRKNSQTQKHVANTENTTKYRKHNHIQKRCKSHSAQ